MLPYTAPGWYHRVAAEFLLHHRIITWADIRYSFSSTAKILRGALQPVLERMEAAWRGDGDMAKQSINAMIGLWTKDELLCTAARLPGTQKTALARMPRGTWC